MNVEDFTYLLKHPNEVVTSDHTAKLEDVLTEYPYFQAARAVHLKGLKNLNSFKYNNALKVAAAYTTDREVLFDFITSKEFLQNDIAAEISGGEPVKAEELPEQLIEKSVDEPLPQTITDADQILDPQLFKSKNPEIDIEIREAQEKAKKELEIGQPLSFTKNERLSFIEWLQLTSQKTVRYDKQTNDELVDHSIEKEVLKQKKSALIDKFIAESPKIVPNEHSKVKISAKKAAKFDDQELMTETLARVYLEQKKYKKAVQAYRILSLKYPEKSGFFADRIMAIKKIQQENT